MHIGISLIIFTDLRYYRYVYIGTDTDTDNNIGRPLANTTTYVKKVLTKSHHQHTKDTHVTLAIYAYNYSVTSSTANVGMDLPSIHILYVTIARLQCL